MGVREAFYQHLVNNAGVLAQVSTRIYPLVADDDAVLPYAVYRRAAMKPEHHLGGRSGMSTDTMELRIYAASLAACDVILEAVRDAVDGLQGVMGFAPNTIVCSACEMVDGADEYIPPADASQQGIYSVVMLFGVTYTEV